MFARLLKYIHNVYNFNDFSFFLDLTFQIVTIIVKFKF